MAYKQLPIVEVAVADLRLDLDNYRIPVKPDDEAAALKYLFASEDVIGQAKLFLRDGYFDNEVPIVVKEGRHYVVLEGNRRVSALKAIADAGLVPEHEHEVNELLTRYASEIANMPTEVRVIVAPSRAAAAPHIARLHTGIPKRRWSRDQQANYYNSLLGPQVTVDDLKALYPGVDVVRFLRMVAMRRFLTGVKFKDKSLRDYVRSSSLTMSAFEYAYRPTLLAAALGVTFDGARIKPTRKEPERIGASITSQQRDAVEYLMAGFRAGDFNTRSPEFKKGTDAQARLLATLLGVAPGDQDLDEDDEPHDDDAEDEAEDDGDGDGGSGGSGQEPPGSGGTGPRGPNHPDRKRLSIAGFSFAKAPANLEKRYQELRKISVADTSTAAAMLIRSVLEATIKFHFSGTPKAVSGELGRVMPAVVAEYGKQRPLKDVINTIASGPVTKPGSVNWFNAAAHNPDYPITEAEVRQAYSLVESLLKRLLTPYTPPTTP
ncbi:hypothetical protein [Nocardioides sp. MH1]|uniref:hypothetical protein n=1 Tax=Nocardioides sp. MH1 TaxID=3242490 RepID=UPI00352062B1